jgi:hypothetical protein
LLLQLLLCLLLLLVDAHLNSGIGSPKEPHRFHQLALRLAHSGDRDKQRVQLLLHLLVSLLLALLLVQRNALLDRHQSQERLDIENSEISKRLTTSLKAEHHTCVSLKFSAA